MVTMENIEDIGLYKEIVEKMPGGFFVYYARGNEELIYCNEGLLRIFGCETLDEFKELTGYTFKGIVHPDDLEEAEKSIWQQIGQSQHALDYLEYRIIKKDGSVRWVEDYGHFAHTERYGDVFYVFVDDATDRLKVRMQQLENANQKLKHAYTKEAQYKNAILYDSIAFFEANLTQNILLSPVIQIVNNHQTEMFEALETEPIMVYSDLIRFFEKRRNTSDSEEFLKFFSAERLIKCYYNNELEEMYETWVTDNMGRKRLFRYTILLVKDDETQDILGLVLVKDLTKLAEGKTLLEIAFRQMETERIRRDTFLSDLSHNLRTPLNGIIGYTNVINIKEVQDNVEMLNNYIEKIQLFSVQLSNVVNGALEYFKVESENSALSEESSISGILQKLEEQIQKMTKAKNLCFAIDTSGIVHDQVFVDSDRLKNILYKLVDNAVKFTEPGGSISLMATEEPIENLSDCAKFCFVVEDNGIGMDITLIEKIFEPFTSGHQIIEDGIIGSGLGLAIVKGLVKMMDGNISVESTPGKGSAFTVTFVLRLSL